METYIKITPETLIKMCDAKISSLEKKEDEAIEIHIANNIKPERKGLFSNKKAVTREDVVSQLDEQIDEYEFGATTLRGFICRHLSGSKDKAKTLKAMAYTASNSPDTLIRLSKEDHAFLQS